MPEIKQDRLALDRASVRSLDEKSGHLHVSLSNISKAAVNPYYGGEINGADELGLQKDKVYNLLRDPEELAKAASSFHNKPLLMRHKPQMADTHDHDLVIGSVSNPVYNHPYLQAELVVWDKDGIDQIESEEARALSSGYWYSADMTPGEYEGVAYDGRMTSITGNHVTICPEGRAGPDVYVGDSAPLPLETTPEPIVDPVLAPPPPKPRRNYPMANTRAKPLSRCALYASGAMSAYIAPKLAEDAKMDVDSLFRGVNAKNWKSSKPKVVAKLHKAVEGKLAQDADIEDVVEMLDRLDDVTDELDEVDAPLAVVDPDDVAPADDDGDLISQVKSLCEGASKEEIEAVIAALKPAESDSDAPPAVAGDDEPKITKSAMDAAIAHAVTAAQRATQQITEKAVMARMQAIEEAKAAVRPYIGEVAAMDSADAYYEMALTENGIGVKGIPPAAFPAMVRMLPKPGQEVAVKKVVAAVAAMDAATVTARSERFPNANRLSK